MEDQIRRLESELRAYKTYWWVFLFVPGMYAILTYALGINVEASGGGGSALDMQLETILVLIIICDALVSFVFSLKFPSEGRLKKILLRKEQGQPRTCGLMLGAVFCESISVGGLLLGFLGVSHQSQIMTTLGYGLIFSGAIAIVFHRWRATKLLTRVLRELPTRMGKRIYLPPNGTSPHLYIQLVHLLHTSRSAYTLVNIPMVRYGTTILLRSGPCPADIFDWW